MLKHISAALIACTALFASAAPSFACACCGTWKVVNVASYDVLNIRSGPGARYSKVGAIPAGSGCVIKTGQCRKNWCRVSYIDQKGWVSLRYLRYIK